MKYLKTISLSALFVACLLSCPNNSTARGEHALEFSRPAAGFPGNHEGPQLISALKGTRCMSWLYVLAVRYRPTGRCAWMQFLSRLTTPWLIGWIVIFADASSAASRSGAVGSGPYPDSRLLQVAAPSHAAASRSGAVGSGPGLGLTTAPSAATVTPSASASLSGAVLR